MSLRVRVLGSAAGGGFPQWNCGCAQCAGLRAGTLGARARTQTSAAVTVDDRRWVLLHASPDVHRQIEAFPPLHARSPRGTPIVGIVLTSGDLDGCLGLFNLRESQPLVIWATEAVAAGLRRNAILRTLARTPAQLTWGVLVPGRDTPLDPEGRLVARALAVPGRLPPHLMGTSAPSSGDTIALVIRDASSGRSILWAPAVRRITAELEAAARTCDALFVDGTFWSGEELRAIDPSAPLAEEMGHLPVGGDGGMLSWLASLGGTAGYAAAPRRVLIHVNNTNPLLRDDGAERAAASGAGVEVAEDGLEVTA